MDARTGPDAHMDTAPRDASAVENVNPILHENYDGSDVTLPATGMQVMKVSLPLPGPHEGRDPD